MIRAFVACKDGAGAVLSFREGSPFGFFAEAGSSLLDDLGLDDAPDGLSVWEGVVMTTYSQGDHDAELSGRFRPLNDDEWYRLRTTGDPFEPKEWTQAELDEASRQLGGPGS